MTSKVALETGSFDWGQGGVYQTPNATGGRPASYPPGWFDAPGGDASPVPEIVLNQGPFTPPAVLGRAGALEPDDPPPPDRMTAREFLHKVPDQDLVGGLVIQTIKHLVGDEFVSITNRIANIMGHELELSDDGLAAIKALLAMEVCANLEQEKERVLGTLLNEGVQAGEGGERTDVPKMPLTATTMEPRKTRRPRAMHRVRKSKANSRTKDVPNVPGAEAGEAGAGSS